MNASCLHVMGECKCDGAGHEKQTRKLFLLRNLWRAAGLKRTSPGYALCTAMAIGLHLGTCPGRSPGSRYRNLRLLRSLRLVPISSMSRWPDSFREAIKLVAGIVGLPRPLASPSGIPCDAEFRVGAFQCVNALFLVGSCREVAAPRNQAFPKPSSLAFG